MYTKIAIMNHLYHKRINSLQDLMREIPCDALLIEDMVNLYYLTGLNLSAGKLLVHMQGAVLIVDSRYFEICEKRGPFPTYLEENNQSLTQLLLLPEYSFIHILAISSSHMTYHRFVELNKEIDKINEHAEKKKIVKPTENLVEELRLLKCKEEIQILKAASNLGSEGFDYICSLLKEGISEEEIALELEIFWKRKKGQKTAFDPIIAFGVNSSMPHYRAGKAVLKKGQHVLIDIGVTYQHYHSDMTRVVYFGKPDPKIIEIHKIVQQAQNKALELCRPGTLIGELDATARDFIASQGYGKYFTHSLGHGVGLDIHEFPSLRNKPPYQNMPLKTGMVITIEPGIYLKDLGGVRIEDTIVITPQGYEDLTKRSKDPIEI
jgi:Xaa-Pro aminopeptidase